MLNEIVDDGLLLRLESVNGSVRDCGITGLIVDFRVWQSCILQQPWIYEVWIQKLNAYWQISMLSYEAAICPRKNKLDT